jgi:hypothetical protein
MQPLSPERVAEWLARCVGVDGSALQQAINLKTGPEREVWDCTFTSDGRPESAIVAIFKPGSLDTVNTSLPPAQAAQKCALAMAELPGLGVPTARLLGWAVSGEEAALASERITPTAWGSAVRIHAARVLARIHSLPDTSLSEALQDLARRSDPREQRIRGGDGPRSPHRTLVHGDYFSANILPVADGLRVIDWETLAWGDPMWDLGFLIGADRDVTQEEQEAIVEQYGSQAPVDRKCLAWHRQRWADWWEKRDQELVDRPIQSTQ